MKYKASNTKEEETMLDSINIVRDALFSIISNTNESFGESIDNIIEASIKFKEAKEKVDSDVFSLSELRNKIIEEIKYLNDTKNSLKVFELKVQDIKKVIDSLNEEKTRLEVEVSDKTNSLNLIIKEKEELINDKNNELYSIEKKINDKKKIIFPKVKELENKEATLTAKEKDLKVIENRLIRLYSQKGVPLKI